MKASNNYEPDFEAAMPPDEPSLGEIIRRLIVVEKKLNLLYEEVLRAPAPCPKPGLCMIVAEAQEHHAQKIERLEERIASIEKWQSRVLGGVGLMLVLLTLFGPALRKLFGLE